MATDVKRLTRPRDDRKLLGVCAGIARYLGLDPTLVRVLWALLTLVTGVVGGVVAYAVVFLLAPEDPAPEPAALAQPPPQRV